MRRMLQILLIVGALVGALAASDAAALTVQGPQTFYADLTPSGVTPAASGTTTIVSSLPTDRTGVSVLFIHGANYTKPDNESMYALDTTAGTSIYYETPAGTLRHSQESANTLRNVSDLGPFGMVQITGATPCQSAISAGAGAYSGVTFEFGVYGTTLKATDERYAQSWATAERIPLWQGAFNSADSPWAIPFMLPSNITDARFYLKATGIRAVGNFRAKVTLGVPKDAWKPPPAHRLASLTFTGPTTSGGSPFTSVPDGTRSLVMFQNSTTGVTAMVQPVSSPSVDGAYVDAGEWFVVEEDLVAGLRAYYVRMLGVGTLTVRCNTAKPY